MVWTTATAIGGGDNKELSGRIWIEINPAGSACAGTVEPAQSAQFYLKGDGKHHAYRDLTALAAVNVTGSSVTVNICADADGDKDVTVALIGNTIIQWASSTLAP
jgi:hypothetical protein